MNLQEYKQEYYHLYEDFAATVKFLLEKALQTTAIPRPQSIQYRAKSVESLRDRLTQVGQLDSQSIESLRRDLAGVRLIFYTNTDVEAFLQSGLVFHNFEVDRDIRIHHPTDENEKRRYRAIHYTVGLTDDRTKLAEYARFKGFRCEIQVQTILNHAWSETSHDIVYKEKPRDGFGKKAMESISARLDRIMDKYLLPAGYEFQRVQHDYQRLQQGKELFDQNILDALVSATDNDVRHQLLIALKEHVLPNYDDINGIHRDLLRALMQVVRSARASEPKPIATPFGELPGRATSDVTRCVIEILVLLRYVDVGQTFDALSGVFRDEPDLEIRELVLKEVKDMATYDLAVWKMVGPRVQTELIRVTSQVEPSVEESIRPLIVGVLGTILNAEISGTTWRADAVTFSRGSVPGSREVKAIREAAISGLLRLFKSAVSDGQRHGVWSALENAMRVTSSGHSEDLLGLSLMNGRRIAEFFLEEASSLSYELKEELEHDYLFIYHRARAIAEDARKGANQETARDLMASIERLRDAINADPQYVRYKMLVGFETVVTEQWESRDCDPAKVRQARESAAERFVDEIVPDGEGDWFPFIERCAATKSSDLATFLVFGTFLRSLAKRKPEVAQRLFGRENRNLLQFLPAFLNGLYEGDAVDIYTERIEHYLERGAHLASCAFHFRRATPRRPDYIRRLLHKAIAVGDGEAVHQCVLLALEGNPVEDLPASPDFFEPAIRYLIDRKDVGWTHGAWFPAGPLPFMDGIAAGDAVLLLENLLEVPTIEYQVDGLLSRIAGVHPELVWNYFGSRLRVAEEWKGEGRYEAIPYELYTLKGELAKKVALAVAETRRWYEEDSTRFRYRGGDLLATVFADFGADVSKELCELVWNGTAKDADFVVAVMENYHGELATHEVLKRIIEKYPGDRGKVASVKSSLDNTGVVTGEFGLVDAMRKKITALESWLSDGRPEVRRFAEEHIRELKVDIADAQRRAEERKALRDLQFDAEEGNDGGDNDEGGAD